ncbi:hypothetical protein [Methylobacterium oryzisoli]|uniref:hypothetical protein n=1 Tax=Methylobacterium oryzisoli TaxID=3385502 RepID=UPI003892B7E7
MTDPYHFARLLIDRTVAASLTFDELAARTGLSRARIGQLARGEALPEGVEMTKLRQVLTTLPHPSASTGPSLAQLNAAASPGEWRAYGDDGEGGVDIVRGDVSVAHSYAEGGLLPLVDRRFAAALVNAYRAGLLREIDPPLPEEEPRF